MYMAAPNRTEKEEGEGAWISRTSLQVWSLCGARIRRLYRRVLGTDDGSSRHGHKGATGGRCGQGHLCFRQGVPTVATSAPEAPPICQCRQWAVLLDSKRANSLGFPIQAPCGTRRVARGLGGWDQLWKHVERHAGYLQERRGADLHSGAPDSTHLWDLLAGEAPSTVHRVRLHALTCRVAP